MADCTSYYCSETLAKRYAEGMAPVSRQVAYRAILTELHSGTAGGLAVESKFTQLVAEALQVRGLPDGCAAETGGCFLAEVLDRHGDSFHSFLKPDILSLETPTTRELKRLEMPGGAASWEAAREAFERFAEGLEQEAFDLQAGLGPKSATSV